MLSILRRLINSKIGAAIALIGLVLVALAFALGDITGLRNSGLPGGATGDTLVKVGAFTISRDDLRRRVQGELEGYRQQQPGLTMAQFIGGGGFENTLERYIDNLALQQFGEKHGLVVGQKAIDGQIASLPQLKGPDGKFDQRLLDQFLGAQQMTVAQFRDEVKRVTTDQLLTAPTLGASQVPDRMALPYASLLLEKRGGSIAFVPTGAMPKGAPPTDVEIADFYKRNVSRYVVPERRVLRYALVTPATVKDQATPSEEEIAAAYQAKAADYAAHDVRSVSQVVLSDKATAEALAAKVKGGTAIDAAAKAAGFEAASLTKLDQAGYAAQTDADAAKAVFAAAKGAVVGPVKAPLGWLVVHVDAVETIPAKSLAQARPELVTKLTADKTAAALRSIREKLDAALNNNGTFDEIVTRLKLTGAATPPVFADGRNPADPAKAPDPALAPIITAGFQGEQGDTPQLVAAGNDGGFALVGVDKVISAAPAPLADIKANVANDIVAQRASAAARKLADAILKKVNAGTPLAKAVAEAGLKLPPVSPLNATRAQLAAAQGRVPPPLAMLFTIKAKSARLLPAPNDQGWFVVYLDTIVPGDARGQQAVILGMRRDIGQALGGEYIQQLAQAARREIGVSKNEAAITKLRGELAGASSEQP